MQQGRTFRWAQLVMLGCLLTLFAPGWAQKPLPSEVLLNGVALNSPYTEVLARHGAPHYIGPAVFGMATVTTLLRPAEPRTVAPTTPGAPGAFNPAAPPNTYNPPLTNPYGANPTASQPKKEGPYMIWRYDGNGRTPDPRANVTTYVFFNEQGVVEAVVVYLNNLRSSPDIQTESGVTFGTKLSDIVKRYDWPEPFTRVGNLYYCSYPAYDVTFALGTAEPMARKVMCIGIGTPFVVTAQALVPGESATASMTPGMMPPGGAMIPVPPMSPGGYPGEGMPPGMGGPPGSGMFPGRIRPPRPPGAPPYAEGE